MNNKNQYHKYINNVNNYNNHNYYNNNYYNNGYGYKKQYSKNNNNMNNNMNNYNEDRKKNNYYNNYFNDMHNDYLYSQITRKKKGNKYNNNNINYEKNNYYENNEEEMMSKSVSENKEKNELMRIQIHLKNNQCKDLVVYKDDDINSLVEQFCTDNFLSENLVEPLINKIKQSLIKLNIVNNYVQLNRDGVILLEKAKKMVKHK